MADIERRFRVLSTERALKKIHCIHHQKVKVNDLEQLAGLLNINLEHTEIFASTLMNHPYQTTA